MKKAISYSLFGYGKIKREDSFDFHTYLRGLMLNVRLNRLIYPGWDIVLNVDHATYKAYFKIFDNINITVLVHTEDELCLSMLWRLKPIFLKDVNGNQKYSHVICRDLDSPTTYREAQAVEQWIKNDKIAHGITDSVSHNVFLMGGMCGFRPDGFISLFGETWDEMLSLSKGIDYKIKGADQIFLERYIFPKIGEKGKESITQHYVLGISDTELNDYYDHIPDIDLGIDEHIKESNHVCGHIGAAGYYEGPMFKFLRVHWDKFNDLIKVEKKYPLIFNWNLK